MNSVKEKVKALTENRKTLFLCLCALIGVLLLLLSARSGRSETAAAPEEDAGLSAARAALEEEVGALCREISGVGECRVMITFRAGGKRTYSGKNLVSETPPEVLGVTVVCEGGGSLAVESALSEMLTALFGIGANRVAVLPMR